MIARPANKRLKVTESNTAISVHINRSIHNFLKFFKGALLVDLSLNEFCKKVGADLVCRCFIAGFIRF
jgi:succinylglutamate desuccinylase